jgi:hypothetical protein
MDQNHMQPRMMFSSKPTMATLTVKVYNGNLSFTIFPKKEDGVRSGPIWSQIFQPIDVAKIEGILKELQTTISAGNQKALTITAWDGEGFSPNATICFGADENNVKYIEVQCKDSAKTPHTIRFAVSANNILSDAGTEFSFAQKTKEGLNGLIWWFDKILPQAMYQTNGTQTKRNGGGGNKSF